MEIYFGTMAFILGLCVGSFINMLTYRTAVRYKLKTQKSKIKNKERSFCDFCGRQLRWYENIPVLSWIIQKGRTRCCHNPLPWEYPAVEMLTGLTFLVLSIKYSVLSIETVILLVTLTLLIFSAVFDLKYMILPDFSTYIMIALSLIYWQNWASALGAFLFLGGLYWGTKGKGMGFGDVKLAVFMGLFLGFPKIIYAFYIAFIVGAVVGIGLMIFKKAGRKTMIPFGPFLILGTIAAKFLISNF